MKTLGRLALIPVAVIAVTSAAHAASRATHTAVGAVTGGLIAGPVGFVGGRVLGYVGGRKINCDLGIDRCRRYKRHHHRRRR